MKDVCVEPGHQSGDVCSGGIVVGDLGGKERLELLGVGEVDCHSVSSNRAYSRANPTNFGCINNELLQLNRQ